MGQSDPVQLSIEGPIACLTFARPDKLNAISGEMVQLLKTKCDELDANAEVLCVILTGEGKAFSAGGDIGEWSALSATQFSCHWIRNGHLAFDALARLRQPVIAVLNGDAFGGGLELAACADFRIAESHIKLGQPETGIGIIPGWSGTQRAVRRFGAQTVRRMGLIGETFTANQAAKLGIVDQLVKPQLGLEAAKLLAKRVVQRGPSATQMTKMLINAAEGEEIERVLDALAGRVAAGSEEHRERISAFAEKRMSNFQKQKHTKVKE